MATDDIPISQQALGKILAAIGKRVSAFKGKVTIEGKRSDLGHSIILER